MAMLPSSFTTIIDEAQRMIRNEYFMLKDLTQTKDIYLLLGWSTLDQSNTICLAVI